ncbi:MAG: hypothetical protein D4R79_15295 [Comamonadaceae bacterium]|nr:MAG: hypothetical protein D4R79_15295 [Comamonadaceae bacterium]
MRQFRHVLSLLLVLGSWPTFAFDASGLHPGMSYQEVKQWQERFIAGTPSKADQIDAMRAIVRTSQVGERGLRNIFKNFDGIYALDPSTPGVWKSVLMQRSSSASQVKGYRRELLYASAMHSDRRFDLTAMNSDLRRTWGNTDADIVFRHKSTGLYGRIEVKDYSISSQQGKLEELKKQIDKMGKEARHTGQVQFWINRRDVLPEIKQYAAARDVRVLDNVKTGYSTKGLPMAEAKNRIEREMVRKDNTRTILARGQAAFGAWMLITAAPKVWNDFESFANSDTPSLPTLLRMGEHVSNALGGGGMVLSGGAVSASKFATQGMQGDLYRMGRSGGIASLASLGLGEAFLISRYATGDVSSREFWTSQWVTTSAAAGGASGMWIGGNLGVWSPFKNPLWLAYMGSIGGTWVGQKFGERSADTYYEWKFGTQDRKFGEYVYALYGVK